MSARRSLGDRASERPNHVDVLIVGAGISGIGAAYHLTTQRPGTSFAILEAQESFGGTWRTHRFPGIRSDSDLYTFGYRFAPWKGPPVASAAEILAYLGKVIDDNGLARSIRYCHKIISARWSSRERRWTLACIRTDTGEALEFTANVLWMCQGYYRHSEGYTPRFEGMERFRGPIVHPQTWPEGLDHAGKRVIVIGSGATAATLVPALAQSCSHVTLLQRSPTYYSPGANKNELADELRRIGINDAWIHEIIRKQTLHNKAAFVQRCLDEPQAVRKELIEGVRALLPPGYDVETHFTPRYDPWRQRLAYVPGGDLMGAIGSGRASVVTDEVDCFTPTGLRLKSGRMLEADIIVTATGFVLNVLGDIDFAIDGKALEFSQAVTWHGMMFTGVPNMVWIMGYVRGAAWTLRVDLVGDFVCRLLNHMADKGLKTVVPRLRPEDEGMRFVPWIDPESFGPSYVHRYIHQLPRCGDRPQWQHSHDYWIDKDRLPAIDLEDGTLAFEPVQAYPSSKRRTRATLTAAVQEPPVR